MRILSGVSRQPFNLARNANASTEPGIAYEIDPVYVAEVREYLGKFYTSSTTIDCTTFIYTYRLSRKG